ncbi:MAG: geranylgeranyl reductase family protein [Nitrospirae bacterium]|nr:MAG: geranylgeranyl reductase family protein [Nitrospirota bacterium]
MMHDVIVVGMGPGGATVATHLARAGLSVLGLEWKTHPRYKVCGGALSARTDRLLEPDYHAVVEETIHRVRFQYAGAEPFESFSPEPIAYMVMRDRFDAHLVRQAREAGASVRENERAVTVREHADRVEVETQQGRYCAKVVVGADGANSLVARTLFPERRGRMVGALEGEVPLKGAISSLGAGTIVLDLGAVAGGYGWVFPKEGRLSIGIGGFQGTRRNPRAVYQGFVKTEPALDGLAVPDGLGHPIPLYAGKATERLPLTTSRALLVGDAAHLVDPMLGEGIYYAVASGRMAAGAIADHLQERTADLRTYDVQVAGELYPEFRAAASLAWAVYTFPLLVHGALRRRPASVHLYADVLKGHTTYQGLLGAIGDRLRNFIARAIREKVASAVTLRSARR